MFMLNVTKRLLHAVALMGSLLHLNHDGGPHLPHAEAHIELAHFARRGELAA